MISKMWMDGVFQVGISTVRRDGAHDDIKGGRRKCVATVQSPKNGAVCSDAKKKQADLH